MAELVLQSRHWDFTAVSGRHVVVGAGSQDGVTPGGQADLPIRRAVHGHLGEWFTLAAAAYSAMRRLAAADGSKRAERLAETVLAAIGQEVALDAELFASLWRGRDGLGCLRASASIAHNLGDLDRVIDLWGLPSTDPLREGYYKLGSLPFDGKGGLRFRGSLWVAGELYKEPIFGSSMARENHRHFALRKPRVLRKKRLFLVPNGPFFDDWARALVRELGATPGGEAFVREVAEALVQGWRRIPETQGYGRALRELIAGVPALELGELPRGTGAKKALTLTQSEYEKRWAEEALAKLDEIPSRA
jgi:hypothetical protein